MMEISNLWKTLKLSDVMFETVWRNENSNLFIQQFSKTFVCYSLTLIKVFYNSTEAKSITLQPHKDLCRGQFGAAIAVGTWNLSATWCWNQILACKNRMKWSERRRSKGTKTPKSKINMKWHHSLYRSSMPIWIGPGEQILEAKSLKD